MATYTAEPFATLSGMVAFEFTGPGTDSPVEIKDIGQLKYELNIPNKDGDIDRIGIKMGQLEITFFDEIGQNLSLYELLFSATFATNSAKMTLTDTFGDEKEVIFEYDQEGIKYAGMDRLITIQFNPPALKGDDITMEDFFSNTGTNRPASLSVDQFTYDDVTTFDATRAGDFIKTYLKTLGENAADGDIIFRSADTDGSGVTSTIYTTGSPSTGADTFLIADVGTAEENETKMVDVVATLAALEGSFFGYAFGVPFYMPRIDTTDKRFIDYTQVEDWNLEITPRNIATVATSIIIADPETGIIISEEPPNLTPIATNIVEINPAASRNVGIFRDAARPFLNKARWDSGAIQWDGRFVTLFPYSPSASGAQTINLELSVCKSGVANYTQTFTGRRIDFVVWGIGSLLPWECVEFGTDAPARLQNKIFRPSSIRYDLIGDKVHVEAYEVTPVGYAPPVTLTITNLDPASIARNTMTSVAVTGTGFTPGTTFQIRDGSGNSVMINAAVYGSATSFTLTLTGTTAGTYTVTAFKPGESFAFVNSLTVTA